MAKKPTSTAVTNWDEELAKAAQVGTALTTSEGGGKFFTLRAGVLSYDDAPLPGNQMIAIIGAWALENVYYEGKFDPNNMAPPTCFAFCKDPDGKDDMAPHDAVDEDEAFDRQHDICKTCPQNQWGSADTGKGKACSNRRRLALLAGGTVRPLGKGKGFEDEIFEDPEHFAKAEPGFLKVPVTSGKGFDAYIRQVAEQFARPSWAVYTRIYLEPDAKSQFKVCFEMIEKVPDECIAILKKRHEELHKDIDFPYRPMAEDEKPATPKKASASKKLGGKR